MNSILFKMKKIEKKCNNHVTEINTDANHTVVYDSELDDFVE